MAPTRSADTTNDESKTTSDETGSASGSTNSKTDGSNVDAAADKASIAGSGGTTAPKVWESRAVIKLIEAGSAAECPFCGERVKFRARHRDQQVICNVYEDGVWQRVEQYHLECYEKADSPHGEAIKR
jgi:DNA-directed RNA polymerase subunit RPC12/RpoP